MANCLAFCFIILLQFTWFFGCPAQYHSPGMGYEHPAAQNYRNMGRPTGLDDESQRILKARQDNNYKSRLHQYGAPGLDPIQTKFAKELLGPDADTTGIKFIRVDWKNKNWTDWESWKPGSDLTTAFPYCKVGLTLKNETAYVVHFGNWNLTQWATESGDKMEEFWKYYEQLVRSLEKDKKVYLIMDFRGFTLDNHRTVNAMMMDLGIFTFWDRMDDAANLVHFVTPNNDSSIFTRMAAPFYGSELGKNKFQWCHVKSQCKTWMLSQFSKDQLPSSYGGTNEAWKNCWNKKYDPDYDQGTPDVIQAVRKGQGSSMGAEEFIKLGNSAVLFLAGI